MVEHSYNGEKPLDKPLSLLTCFTQQNVLQTQLNGKCHYSMLMHQEIKGFSPFAISNCHCQYFQTFFQLLRLNGRSQWNKQHVGRNTMLFRDTRSPSLNNVFPRMHKRKKRHNTVFSKKRKVRVLRYGTKS